MKCRSSKKGRRNKTNLHIECNISYNFSVMAVYWQQEVMMVMQEYGLQMDD